MKIQSAVIAILFSALLAPTLAARQIDSDGGGTSDPSDGGGSPDPSDPDPRCPQHATATLSASPSMIAHGQSATLSWSATLPPDTVPRPGYRSTATQWRHKAVRR